MVVSRHPGRTVPSSVDAGSRSQTGWTISRSQSVLHVFFSFSLPVSITRVSIGSVIIKRLPSLLIHTHEGYTQHSPPSSYATLPSPRLQPPQYPPSPSTHTNHVFTRCPSSSGKQLDEKWPHRWSCRRARHDVVSTPRAHYDELEQTHLCFSDVQTNKQHRGLLLLLLCCCLRRNRKNKNKNKDPLSPKEDPENPPETTNRTAEPTRQPTMDTIAEQPAEEARPTLTQRSVSEPVGDNPPAPPSSSSSTPRKPSLWHTKRSSSPSSDSSSPSPPTSRKRSILPDRLTSRKPSAAPEAPASQKPSAVPGQGQEQEQEQEGNPPPRVATLPPPERAATVPVAQV